MKQYIIIIFIALHLISSTLYATKTVSNQHNVGTHPHKCSFHDDTHKHYHTHNGSTHQHKHSHAQKTINLLDFFVELDNNKPCITLYSKENYLEIKYYISNPSLKSLFRPPIV